MTDGSKMSNLRFIPPAIPVAKICLARGDARLDEAKLDGWRLRARKYHGGVVMVIP
jgi:hypothetical protein